MRSAWHTPAGKIGIVTCPFHRAKGRFCLASRTWEGFIAEGVVLGMADDGVHVRVFWPNWCIIEHRPTEIYYLRRRGAYKLVQRRAHTARAGCAARAALKLRRLIWALVWAETL